MLEPSSPRTFFVKSRPRRSGVSLERDVRRTSSCFVLELTIGAVGGAHLAAGISNPSSAFQATSFLSEHCKVRIAALMPTLCRSHFSLAIVHPLLTALLRCRGV